MRVAIFGAGVAGLSVAQELVERGIEVDVYERLPVAGGKARSIVIQREAQRGLPGEHGFRYFPGFYRHVIDTMSRIPRPEGGTVADNLVDAMAGNFAEVGYPPVMINTVGPTSLGDLVDGLRSIEGFVRAVSLPELEFFAGKLWQVMTSCRERRLAEYEDQSWSTFLEADSRSAAYNTWFAGAMTHTLIAASGAQASSRTVGDITVQLVTTSTQPGKPGDRLLNAPTTEAWIDPWLAHLESSGRFRLHTDHRLLALRVEDDSCVGAEVSCDGQVSTVTADVYVERGAGGGAGTPGDRLDGRGRAHAGLDPVVGRSRAVDGRHPDLPQPRHAHRGRSHHVCGLGVGPHVGVPAAVLAPPQAGRRQRRPGQRRAVHRHLGLDLAGHQRQGGQGLLTR